MPGVWLSAHENAERFGSLMTILGENKLSSRGAKDTLTHMISDNRTPEVIAQEQNLMQQSDTGTLEAIARKVIDANPIVVNEYRAGKAASLQFLIGQGMKESRGSANPALLREAFERLLS
jgi:aspartyl-tRNA(Asn)/glutamyl-tRNA(Gln) amidotransferase subunit B